MRKLALFALILILLLGLVPAAAALTGTVKQFARQRLAQRKARTEKQRANPTCLNLSGQSQMWRCIHM